jgi:chemotaxis protein CheC
MTVDFQLSEFRKDALRELGNMSASHAANSLSEVLGSKVEITAPNLNVVSMKHLPEVLEDDLEEVIPVHNHFHGGISGTVILLFPMKYTPEGVKKMSEVMMQALAKAITDFFGVEIRASISVLPSMGPKSVRDYLISKLGRRAEKAVFFNTNFIFSDVVMCHFFLSLNYDDVSSIMKAQVPEFTSEYGSFADMLETFEKLKNVEVKLYHGLKETEVPREEVRSFLRNFDASDIPREKLYGRIIYMLEDCGIGDGITLKRVSPLEYVFTVPNCNICRAMPSISQGNSCYTTSTALGRIFSELLRIGCEVKEVKCAKTGSEACVHLVSLEQLDVFSILPEHKDLEFLNTLAQGPLPMSRLPGDVEESVHTLKQFGILDDADGKLNMTELGKIFVTFTQNKPQQGEEEMEEQKAPWE